MVRACELMIGNLVEFQGRIVKVERVSDKEIYAKYEGYNVWIEQERLMPITITGSFLCKNGFIESISNDSSARYIHKDLDLLFILEKEIINGVLRIRNKGYREYRYRVYYVHQLQNNLRISDINIDWKY